MNLYGRFFLFLMHTLFRKKDFSPLGVVSSHFRVWLHDMDLNVHLTAARYFSFGDLGRMNWLAKNKLLRAFVAKGTRGVINAQEITYIREFQPFSKVELQTELICFDEKYGYFEQRFYKDGSLYAVSHARMAFLMKRKVISFGDFFQSLGHSIKSPPETNAIREWKLTLQAKKEQFS